VNLLFKKGLRQEKLKKLTEQKKEEAPSQTTNEANK